MSAVSFEVAGKPVPWARSGANGKSRFTPAKVRLGCLGQSNRHLHVRRLRHIRNRVTDRSPP